MDIFIAFYFSTIPIGPSLNKFELGLSQIINYDKWYYIISNIYVLKNNNDKQYTMLDIFMIQWSHWFYTYQTYFISFLKFGHYNNHIKPNLI